MNSDKVYKAVVEAKKLIECAAEELGGQLLWGFDYRKVCKENFTFGIACKAVLESGAFYEDLVRGWTFMMPSTACVIENYKWAKKNYKYGLRLNCNYAELFE